jgi:hypothetical protein
MASKSTFAPSNPQLALQYSEERLLGDFLLPAGYKGLYGFHKYWGKKPAECVSFLIESLSCQGDVIVDPFIGHGTIAREAQARGRRFIGGDLNPAAIAITRLLLNPPSARDLEAALTSLEKKTRNEIEASYCSGAGIASHFLWEDEELLEVWSKSSSRQLDRCSATEQDEIEALRWNTHKARVLQPLSLFDNGRINTRSSFSWHDLFCGRAIRNIELLYSAILEYPLEIREALLCILTSSVGQMSKMVFAISNRGINTKGQKIEVGSWVIGYWRPKLHFEINVWNCFSNKANKLLKSLKTNGLSRYQYLSKLSQVEDVIFNRHSCAIINSDAVLMLNALKDGSVDLFVTDPPHGDRIPYLELSEMWNAILGQSSSFESELVVSDAKNRNKNEVEYEYSLGKALSLMCDKLKSDGLIAIMFNASIEESWSALRTFDTRLNYAGAFPMVYSSGSVVQDNRAGSLKHDYVLLYTKGRYEHRLPFLESIPGWTLKLPNQQE